MPKTRDVGVVVGRFQVHRLHDAHRKLLTHVYSTHVNMVVVLGLSAARVSTDNPLDFEARKQMILADFPKATIFYMKDERDDVAWSAKLDGIINEYLSPTQSVCLYGGRDSFINRYKGRYDTDVLEPDVFISGTELRKSIAKSVKGTEDFRAGVIWAAANGYPRPIVTVDIAVYREGDTAVGRESREWLLVRKPNEKGWRFPGGFMSDADLSMQMAAKRELAEETGVETGPLEYVWDGRVDDWRYRYEKEKINTTLFATKYIFGAVKPADDVAEAQWVSILPFSTVLTSQGARIAIVDEHLPLVEALLNGGWL